MSKAQIIILADLAFGDSGKGSWTSFLADRLGARAFVRFNGGCQAGHRVVLADGFDHIYHTFSSGHHHADAITYLDSHVLVSPHEIVVEALDLKNKGVSNPLDRLVIHQQCPVVTPFHEAASKLRERHRELTSKAHGSCGFGIGELMRMRDNDETVLTINDCRSNSGIVDILESIRIQLLDSLHEAVSFDYDSSDEAHTYIADLIDPTLSKDYAKFISQFITNVVITDDDYLIDLVRNQSHVVFEPAQGVLLDEVYGFYPYNTWSTTTTENAESALSLVNDLSPSSIYRFGIIRSYMTRHGPGPKPTEDPSFGQELDEPSNFNNRWQKDFRRGPLDLPLIQYAVKVNPEEFDGILVSHMDHALQLCNSDNKLPINRSYREIDSGRTLFKIRQMIQDPMSTSFTELISSLTPEIEEVFLSAFPEIISRYLNLPIAGLSYSAKCTDKIFFA